MSALARWFLHSGKKVMGYDKTPSALTEKLEAEGIEVIFDEKEGALFSEIIDKKDAVLVVYTPAIPADHPQLAYFTAHKYALHKRSQVLGALTQHDFNISVAGTHGKTTISAMLTHIFYKAHHHVVGFVGGELSNYGRNIIINDQSTSDKVLITEADEFDRSFHSLHPNIAIVSSADPDHLDVYHSHTAMYQAFTDFIARLPDRGLLIIKDELQTKLLNDLEKDLVVISYGLANGIVQAQNITIEDGYFVFDYLGQDININQVRLQIAGFHNVENALAAITTSLHCDITPDEIKNALASFKGVKRRFEYIIKQEDLVFIDDYAHHPVEIRSLLQSVRQIYPNKKLTVVFQPHLFSRTQDFADGFAESLSLADELLLLEIYPAREQPIPGVDATLIFDKLQLANKWIVPRNELVKKLQSLGPEVLVTLGAGDIDRMVKPIKEALI